MFLNNLDLRKKKKKENGGRWDLVGSGFFICKLGREEMWVFT